MTFAVIHLPVRLCFWISIDDQAEALETPPDRVGASARDEAGTGALPYTRGVAVLRRRSPAFL